MSKMEEGLLEEARLLHRVLESNVSDERKNAARGAFERMKASVVENGYPPLKGHMPSKHDEFFLAYSDFCRAVGRELPAP